MIRLIIVQRSMRLSPRTIALYHTRILATACSTAVARQQSFERAKLHDRPCVFFMLAAVHLIQYIHQADSSYVRTSNSCGCCPDCTATTKKVIPMFRSSVVVKPSTEYEHNNTAFVVPTYQPFTPLSYSYDMHLPQRPYHIRYGTCLSCT